MRQEEGAEVDLQVGRTVTKAPRYMRTQLWLGVLQRYPGLGNKAAKQYFGYLRKARHYKLWQFRLLLARGQTHFSLHHSFLKG